MKPKTLTLDGKTSRPFDMRCYRAMSAAYKNGNSPEIEVPFAGVADLLEMDDADLLREPPKKLAALMKTVNMWYYEAVKAIQPGNSGNTILDGDPVLAMYGELLRHSGILPDEIDRQDPVLFFSVITERHTVTQKVAANAGELNPDDIPPELRAFYGL